MHVLLTNDDGPLDDKSCPYIKYLVDTITSQTDWKLSICVPNQQRSWIGKAHFAGRELNGSYIYTLPSTETENDGINAFKGPFESKQELAGYQEWNLVDSTPAACVDIGLNHLIKDDVDLVLSGPNFGKNSSNLYILASGTVGSAMEGALHGKKSIALSYSYSKVPHSYNEIKTASELSVKTVEALYNNWDNGVDLYTINVPLNEQLSLSNTKVFFAPILQNKWGHSIYEQIGENKFKWNPDFAKIHKDGLIDFDHSDNRVLLNDNISVTPLRAKFHELEPLTGQLKLLDLENETQLIALLDIPKDSYVYEPLKQSFAANNFEITSDRKVLKSIPNVKVFHYAEYEDIDLDLIEQYPQNYFIPTNIYRKGLIRKNYLANLIHQFKVKNPKSILNTSFPMTYQFELDYAEFLDDALDECYELRDEVNDNDKIWILKPSMSDKGQGIRIFKTLDQLQEIFNEFEENDNSDEDDEDNNGIITSQLRQFIVQEYDSDPLLLPEYQNRKFHFRVYVVANSNLQVYVYKQILTLFADTPFKLLEIDTAQIDIAGHLTNTCIQITEDVVEEFWKLKGLNEFEKNIIFNKICQITGQTFKAATVIDKINFQPLPNATEIFGVDFIVDSNLNLNLLEVNAYPDFKQTGPHLKDLIDGLFSSVFNEIITPNMTGNDRVPNDKHLIEVFNTKGVI